MAKPPTAMSIRHPVLGLIIERPSYGYQLAKRLEERCPGLEWGSTGVYSALDTLERLKQVRATGPLRETHGSGRAANRRMYEATDKGRDGFREWLIAPSPPVPVRQPLDLKIQFASPKILPKLIEQTWGQELFCMEQLKTLTGTQQAPVDPKDWSSVAALLQRNAAIKTLQVRVEWLQEARRVMKAFLDHNPAIRSR
jgi:DNA-binding PadR family transcriptional regulator